jgi:predicted flavoprotein YhiN
MSDGKTPQHQKAEANVKAALDTLPSQYINAVSATMNLETMRLSFAHIVGSNLTNAGAIVMLHQAAIDMANNILELARQNEKAISDGIPKWSPPRPGDEKKQPE